MSEGRMQVRFGGFGGQGIVLAGRLLGKAASLYDGKEAVFTQAYGPEARGGASRADVIIADEPVDYPYVTQPDVLAVLFQEAYIKFSGDLPPGALLIVEEDLVTPAAGASAVALPAARIADEAGQPHRGQCRPARLPARGTAERRQSGDAVAGRRFATPLKPAVGRPQPRGPVRRASNSRRRQHRRRSGA